MTMVGCRGLRGHFALDLLMSAASYKIVLLSVSVPLGFGENISFPGLFHFAPFWTGLMVG